MKTKSLNILGVIALGLVLPLASQAANNQNVTSYPYVHILNSTNMHVKGEVKYASAFCSNDSYAIGPHSSWTATSRGVCLVAGITVKNIDTGKSGDSYESSGTSYSQFVIYQNAAGNPEVTRKVS